MYVGSAHRRNPLLCPVIAIRLDNCYATAGRRTTVRVQRCPIRQACGPPRLIVARTDARSRTETSRRSERPSTAGVSGRSDHGVRRGVAHRQGHDYVQSLDRGLAVIRAFSQDDPRLTLSEVARATGLTRATARRLLLTFGALGYVDSDEREFELTPRVLELGYAYLSSSPIGTSPAVHGGARRPAPRVGRRSAVLDRRRDRLRRPRADQADHDITSPSVPGCLPRDLDGAGAARQPRRRPSSTPTSSGSTWPS